MARTLITPTRVTLAGVDPADVDVAAEITDGNMFVYKDGRELYVMNGDDASLQVTIPTPITIGKGDLAVQDTIIVIPAGKPRRIKGFGPEHRQEDGTVHVDYSGTTPASVTVAVFD
ncbi:hypothetical protein [Herbidospora mongoliensis]|uniref:hypothetical protein n=1 Tax=Herbidospora mongoliensis TaxID=688067 RepID=UPI0008364025|nr:hypothetical protein [Herbidospora mongoliensis]